MDSIWAEVRDFSMGSDWGIIGDMDVQICAFSVPNWGVYILLDAFLLLGVG